LRRVVKATELQTPQSFTLLNATNASILPSTSSTKNNTISVLPEPSNTKPNERVTAILKSTIMVIIKQARMCLIT